MTHIKRVQNALLSELEHVDYTALSDDKWQVMLATSFCLFDAEVDVQRINALLAAIFTECCYLHDGVYILVTQSFCGAGVGQSRSEHGDVMHEWRHLLKGPSGALVYRRYRSAALTWTHEPEVSEEAVLHYLNHIGCSFPTYSVLKKQLVEHHLYHPSAVIDSQHQGVLENRFMHCPLRHENWVLIHQSQPGCGQVLPKTQPRSEQSGRLLAQASPKNKSELSNKVGFQQLRAQHVNEHDGITAACDFFLQKDYNTLATLDRDRARLKELLHPDFATIEAASITQIVKAFDAMAARLHGAQIADTNTMLRVCTQAVNAYFDLSLPIPKGNQQSVAKAGLLSARQWQILLTDIPMLFRSHDGRLRAEVSLILMRYLGLRTEELFCLRLSSISSYTENGVRIKEGLKSEQARRNLSLELIPEPERSRVVRFFEFCLARHSSHDTFIFNIEERKAWTEAVSEKMRELTGNSHADSYSLRHCALSRLGAILFIDAELAAEFTQLTASEIAELRRQLVDSTRANAFRAQAVFERLAGHLEPDVGLAHYNHAMDLLLNQTILCTMPDSSLQRLGGMSSVSEGKFLQGAEKSASHSHLPLKQRALTSALKQSVPNLKKGGRPRKKRIQLPSKRSKPTLMSLYKHRDNMDILGSMFGKAFQQKVETRSNLLCELACATLIPMPLLKHKRDIEYFQFVSDIRTQQNAALLHDLVTGDLVYATVGKARRAYSELHHFNHRNYAVRFLLVECTEGRPTYYWEALLQDKGVGTYKCYSEGYSVQAVIAKKHGDEWRLATHVMKQLAYYSQFLV